jgi:DnaK suppressor protein
MSSSASPLDASFIEKQRRHLTQLQTQLLAALHRDEAEESSVKDAAGESAREYEDDAQKLAMQELQEQLAARDRDRLERVVRALKKIDEGSYGLSDASGKPIPRERLEAVPEAIFRIDEEKAYEQRP